MPRLEATIKTRDGLCPASLFTPAEGAGPWPAVIFFMDRHPPSQLLAGVHTSGVVLSTVRHAGDLDYRLVVVRDCCADPDAELHAVLLDIVIAKQAAVVTTAELAGALPGRSS